MKKRLIAGTINYYPPEDGWENTHLDLSDRAIYNAGEGAFVAPDVVANLGDEGFRDCLHESSFDQVRCHQVFEHLTIEQAPICLANFLWVLRPQGTLDIEVPNIRRIIQGWQEGELEWADMIRNMYGSSSPAMQDDHYNAHRWGWDADTLGRAIIDAGFSGVDGDDDAFQLRMIATAP